MGHFEFDFTQSRKEKDISRQQSLRLLNKTLRLCVKYFKLSHYLNIADIFLRVTPVMIT